MMFGMMGQFLPGAAAVLIAANPVLLGAGAVFGGMQLVDERKRKVAQRAPGRPARRSASSSTTSSSRWATSGRG